MVPRRRQRARLPVLKFHTSRLARGMVRESPAASSGSAGHARAVIAARVPALVVYALSCVAAMLGVPAAAGANLLGNPSAEVGAASGQGWDSVTIPGWKVAAGLPTVVRYGTKGFPAPSRRARRAGHSQMFAGGVGGTARLVQWVALRAPGGGAVAAGAPFTLSARLGASSTSRASVSVAFFATGGRRLAVRRLAPVGGRVRSRATGLSRRSMRGRLPAGTVRAEVMLRLATSLRNVDGPSSPTVGYDRAVADDLRFDVRADLRLPRPLKPPVARIPRYDHVFLFSFENQDLGAVVGNRRAAPYYNSLLAQGSQLGQLFAEEHPSDGNYLALAGGSTFGIPLTDPLEINSQYTIRAPQIGDRVAAAGETWKAYEESSAGPCDDTVHGYYWNDDLPMMYFADVRTRPAYCSSHVVPLESMATDLSRTSTTPNFTWVGINDCDDMEGCGIRAGDRFLANQLGQIMRSPAWRTQRSLAIITFDEDGYDHQHPAQRVPTVVLGSTGVRHGYVSGTRYTHYSLLRTIEGALGLRTLTRNDLFAQAANDIFRAGVPGASAPPSPYVAPEPGVPSPGASPAAGQAARRPPAPGPATAFVVSARAGTVTPITLATRKAGPPIAVGRAPQAIALSPDGRMAYVVNSGSDSVTPIETGTRRRERTIRVGRDPRAIAVTPDGRTAFVSNGGADTVTPIDLRTGTPGVAIPVGTGPRRLAITPDGRTVYVLDWGGGEVTPIDVGTDRPRAPIPVGSYPSSIVMARDGRHAYVANYGSNTVTPLTIADDRAGRSIPVGQAPNAVAITPNGATVEVVDGDINRVTPIATGRARPGRRIRVGVSPEAVAISRSGATAYVVNTISGTVTPIDVARGRTGKPISVGTYAYPTEITLAPDGRTAVVTGTYAGTITLLNTRTHVASSPIKVGALPVAAAVTR
jgi:YVTN family beta-propeller protein